jgi:V-type H+-transporting ATPase subunit H
MLVARLLPFAKNLSTRKWSDEDIMEDVQFLHEELKARFESLTYAPRILLPLHSFSNMYIIHRTYDEYTSELSSGHLSWSPVHDSELFWRENATKLNDRDFEQLKCVHYFMPSIVRLCGVIIVTYW